MPKTAWILTFTPATDEPRVRRQADACRRNGWNVIVFGYEGASPIPNEWKLAVLPQPKTIFRSGPTAQIWRLTSMILAPFFILTDRAMLAYYWHVLGHKNARDFMNKSLRSDFYANPDIVIANDYKTAPLAAEIAALAGCSYAVDVHEFATEQYMHNPVWRFFMRPWVARMENYFLARSALNTTVCAGIADLLKEKYSINLPTVIRSMPSYTGMPYRPAGDKINVLYQGILYRTRGLEALIDSVPLWRPEFHLTIRGPGGDRYIRYLQKRCKKLGVLNRVAIEPPVLFQQMIAAANSSDIGYFVQTDSSMQKKFTLPNKFFEYIMAGTALCVSDLPEMSRLARQYNVGRLVQGFGPVEIAAVINSFDRQSIDAYKKNSLEAAKILSWDREVAILSQALADVCHDTGKKAVKCA